MNSDPEGWDDDSVEYCFDEEVQCACGSVWFYFTGYEASTPLFTIDSGGNPLDSTGHPICGECGLDYPVAIEDCSTGEIVLFFSGDLPDPDCECECGCEFDDEE